MTEFSKALVERVARAIANANSGDVNPNWPMWTMHARAALTASGLDEAIEPYCPRCTCDECRLKRETADIVRALSSSEPVQCWSCSCGWVGCYTASDLAEYGEPTECQRCYRERLEPCDPPARARSLTDKLKG